MFKYQTLPPTVSIFSSIGSDPLGLFVSQTDPGLPNDSHITIIDDTKPIEQKSLLEYVHLEEASRSLRTTAHPVLHLQSPTLMTTFIRTPSNATQELSITHPWLHFQVQNLGKPWSFEVGIRDQRGIQGVIRCSTFLDEPSLLPSSPPLLHIPLKLPPMPSSKRYEATLTSWNTVSMNLSALVPHFGTHSLLDHSAVEKHSLPRCSEYPTRFESLMYIKVYATCRIRRIWVTDRKALEGVRLPWELELYE